MSTVIGPAKEFYRLRVSRFDLGDGVEFDWRDDVLWRATPASAPSETDIWVVEAVTLGADEIVIPIAEYGSAEEARDALDEIAMELPSMTKTEFESEYLDSGPPEG